jgi:putative sigma-54 modulation protein
MKTDIQSIAFNLQKELNDFVNGKVKKLKRLYSEIMSIEILLRLNKSETKENKVCRIRLVIPGYDMHVNAQYQTFEAATAAAIEGLERQIEKRKTRLMANRLINI